MISFKGAQYPKAVILFAVFFYVRWYCNLMSGNLSEVCA